MSQSARRNICAEVRLISALPCVPSVESSLHTRCQHLIFGLTSSLLQVPQHCQTTGSASLETASEDQTSMQCHSHQGARQVNSQLQPLLICPQRACLPAADGSVGLLCPLRALTEMLACSVSDEEASSQSSNGSSSTAAHSSGHHATADIDWDSLGFGIDNMAPVRQHPTPCH